MPFALISSNPSLPFEENAVFHAIFVVLFVVVNISFAYDVIYRLVQVSQGMPSANRFDEIGQRIKSVVLNVLLQKKLFRHPVRGLLHVFIFYGFLYYFLHTTTQIVAGAFMWGHEEPYLFHLLPMGEGEIGAFYSYGLDFVSLFVLVGLIGFAARRWVFKAPELDRPSGQSAIVIGLIGTLMVSTLLGQGALTKIHGGEYAHAISPIGTSLGALFSESNAEAWQAVFWWVHILTVFIFMLVVPRSKHSHLIFAPFNFWFINTGPKGALSKIDLEDENLEAWGSANVKEFGWPSLLDGLSCIECGRCTLSCPANRTGKMLNPKKIMTDLKHAMVEKMPALMAGEEVDSRVIDNYTTQQELWACTSCYACVDQCPVGNNQLDAIIDMRRSLVLTDSNFPAELQGAFQNMENNYNPWGVGAHLRAEWTEGLEIKTMSEVGSADNIDYLYWVGCAGSFDDRNKKIAQSFVKILNKANVKFAILGDEEACTGDSARRAGNEYLFQTLAAGNIETLNRYKVKKIVTACPHCFNTLNNEYPQFGGDYEVVHHSQLIEQLIEEGRLDLDPKEKTATAFHDSCYLGRHNDVYSAPREVIQAGTGQRVREINESEADGMCCGAGGAQMWMEETEGTRVNVARTEQLLKAETKQIATSCPFCITMIKDGVTAHNKSDEVEVRDIAEIVADAIKPA